MLRIFAAILSSDPCFVLPGQLFSTPLLSHGPVHRSLMPSLVWMVHSIDESKQLPFFWYLMPSLSRSCWLSLWCRKALFPLLSTLLVDATLILRVWLVALWKLVSCIWSCDAPRWCEGMLSRAIVVLVPRGCKQGWENCIFRAKDRRGTNTKAQAHPSMTV